MLAKKRYYTNLIYYTFFKGCLVPSEHQIYIESDQWLCSICTEITAAEQNEK